MPLIDKQNIRRQLRTAFIDDGTIEKIVVFGSFITSESPNDLDLAVFCNSSDDYLTLSLALRKKLRDISSIIPIDLVPIAMPCDPSATFMQKSTMVRWCMRRNSEVQTYDKRGPLPWHH